MTGRQAEIDAYEYWKTQLATKSMNTWKIYKSMFNNFLAYVEQTPNSLIETQRKSMAGRGKDPRLNRIIEDKVLQWVRVGLKDKTPATKQVGLAAVKSFFDLNFHPLNLGKTPIKSDSIGSRIPTKQEIIRVLDACKWKGRATIMFLKDSGLRCSDLPLLTWEQKRDMGAGFWSFTIITEKNNVKAHAFVGPETTRLLENFPRKTGRIFGKNAYWINKTLNRTIKQAGIQGLTLHGLRKYFVTSLERAGIVQPYILAMMGKRTSPYDEYRETYLFEAYKKAYPELSIFTSEDQGEELGLLKKRIAELERKIEELRKLQ